MLREMGFSLEDEIPKLEKELEGVKEERGEVKRKAKEVDDQDSKRFKQFKRRWKEIEAERVEIQSKISRFQDLVDEWDDTEFRVRELRFGEVQNIKDVVSSESFDVDVELREIEGTPLQGLYQSQLLEYSVVSMPDDAPDDPNDLPEVLGDWLLEKAESINSLGEDELGNMSLEEAISSES